MADYDFSGSLEKSEGGEAAPLPSVNDAASYEAIAPGSAYLDPGGKQRFKPHAISGTTPEEQFKSYQAVPEGQVYIDSNGKQRTKPKYGGLDWTSETLYHMALTPEEKRKALARGYGVNSVKEDDLGELYVESPEGPLKPSHGNALKRVAAGITAEAAPVAGATAGGIAGGLGGATTGPGGAAAGGILGATAGGTAGQAVNDLFLSLAGIYDRSPREEAHNLATSAGLAAAGEGAGRAIVGGARMISGLSDAASSAGKKLPGAVANIVGADVDPEATRTAARLANQGVKVPPSAWMKEAPKIHKLVETFDPAFRKQDVLGSSAVEHYEREGGKIAEELGVTPKEPLTKATEKVSSREAGEAAIKKVHETMKAEDAALASAMNEAKMTATAAEHSQADEFRTLHVKAMEILAKRAETNRVAAQAAVDVGFTQIRADVEAAVKVAKTGNSPGDMMRQAAAKISAASQAFKRRARILYDAADVAAGGAKPNVAPIVADAKVFIESMPEPFRQKYPDIVKALTELKPGATTFGQLRNLRSLLRQNVDPTDLTGGMREGIYKFFAGKLDRVLHDINAVPELKTAAKMLDDADVFYGANIPRFRDEIAQGVVSAIRAGMPVDAKVVAGAVMKEGHTEEMRELKRIFGPTLWKAVQAEDTNAMFMQARTLVPGQINGKAFADQVLQRVKSGVLEAGYDKETSKKLAEQARRVLMLSGDLKVPIAVSEGDTVAIALKRAEDALKAMDELAKVDPIGSLAKSIKEIDLEHQMAQKVMRQTRRNDPLGFLFELSAQPVKSADRIIGSPDLLMASAARFGVNSKEFTLIRQVAAMRLLQREAGKLPDLITDFSTKLTPEAQQLLFPGVTLEQTKRLAKDMDFLLGWRRNAPDAGGSMAAASRVLHPSTSFILPQVAQFPIPGADFMMRFMLGKYYATVTKLATNPAFISWVAKGLEGGPEARETVRAAWQKAMNIGGGLGAGAAEAERGEDDGGRTSIPTQGGSRTSSGWRAEYERKYGRRKP